LPNESLDGLDVWAVAVRRDLEAVAEPRREVHQEGHRVGTVSLADEPGADELRVRIERDPRSNHLPNRLQTTMRDEQAALRKRYHVFTDCIH